MVMGTHPVFFIHNEKDFWKRCAETFLHQFDTNRLFQQYCKNLGYLSGRDFTPDFIPFMPVEAFRDHELKSGDFQTELLFKSSGTTGMMRSSHHIKNPELYIDSITFSFDFFFPENPVVLAYTPGYNENPDSSLVWMLQHLTGRDQSGLSGFLPLGSPVSRELLGDVSASGRQLVLFGAAFGLMEMAEQFPVPLPPGSLVVETGGMKTYRREMSRNQMHGVLSEAFHLDEKSIQSEYGMCEMLSQAYAKDGQHFRTPNWLRFITVHPENPFQQLGLHEVGRLAVIDLANQDSCAFLLTGDRAVRREQGVEILGRVKNWNLRGCNFLLEEEA